MSPYLSSTGRHLAVLFRKFDLGVARAFRSESAAISDLLEIGRLEGLEAHYVDAERYVVEAASLARALGDRLLFARASLILAEIAVLQERYTTAHPLLQTAVASFRQADDTRLLLDALIKLGAVNLALGDSHEAQISLLDAVAVAGDLGDSDAEARAEYNLGLAAHIEKRYVIMNEHWRRALALRRVSGNRRYEAKMRLALQQLETLIGGEPDQIE